MEYLLLRIHDFDFGQQQLVIRDSKGNKDRITLFPVLLHPRVREQMDTVRNLHKTDLGRGYGETVLPAALGRKYPNAARTLGWQFAFPATTICRDPRSGKWVRYHLHATVLRKALGQAKLRAGIDKHLSTHVLRHSFAMHLLEDGANIRVVQTLLGHKDVKTTEVYTHVMDKRLSSVKSPLETLSEQSWA